MSDKLTADEYREALQLVLVELYGLDFADVLDAAQRIGRVKAHITTIVGQDPRHTEPIYGLRALRRGREEVAPSEQR